VTVREVIYLGSERKYELEDETGQVLIARHQVGKANLDLQVGDQLFASWDVEHGVLVSNEPES